METAALERLDSFPYRHRVTDLMAAPVVALNGEDDVGTAARLMNDRRISSVLVLDGDRRPAGILTERDVLRLAATGRSPSAMTVLSAMSAPVRTIEADALVYRALARMARLGVRHLPVVDGEGRAIGMLTSGALLKQRATLALTLGDEIATAQHAGTLRAAHDKLPGLARALRDEKATPAEVSAVVSGVTRDLTARAGELALAEMMAAGRGGPPGRWCLLVLGSAGRGESMLVPDQDNALILDGADGDDPWFAAFADRLNRLLDEAGVPFCKGGVMARNTAWRRSLDAWRDQVDAWIARPQPEALLNADIFFDFVPVLGDAALAGSLRAHIAAAMAAAPTFLAVLAAVAEPASSAFDLLGRMRLRDGRIDLKLHGIFPIVAGARAIGLAWGATVTSSDGRLADAATRGAIPHDAAQGLAEKRAVLVEAILDQQLEDIAAGRAPDNRVDPGRLARAANGRLREALKAVAGMPELVRSAVSSRQLGRLP